MSDLLKQLKEEGFNFASVLAYIESKYQVHPTAFQNGDVYNESTQNQGSAKVLYYAKLQDLSKEDTLSLFAEHYQNVLENPLADNHQNIRQFMTNGWEGVKFEGEALS